VLILIPGGCLALTLLILLSNWITFETLGRGSTTASGVLDWQEAYGTQTASEPPQTTVSVSGNPSVFSLPQVTDGRCWTDGWEKSISFIRTPG
jgi:hypothetical protein